MFLLAAAATTLTCIEAELLIDKMYLYDVKDSTRAEMILLVLEETPECWDAKAD
tara:strand:- start:24 stop:185 length:162 start_codon:yes stop_codon:yes gene_type:complete